MTTQEYLNLYKSKAEINAMPNGIDERLQTEKEMCVASLGRVFESFRPLFLSIESDARNRACQDSNKYRQWFIIYFMALASTRRDYAARCLNYVTGRDFMDKIYANYEPRQAEYIIHDLIEKYYSIFEDCRTDAELLREMYISAYHSKLGMQIRHNGELKTGSDFRAVANPYMKKNAPADLWKVGLNVRNIRNNVRRVLRTQKTK